VGRIRALPVLDQYRVSVIAGLESRGVGNGSIDGIVQSLVTAQHKPCMLPAISALEVKVKYAYFS